MENEKRGSIIDLILKILIIFMILFVSAIVVRSMIFGTFDMSIMIMGIMFIFFLIFIQWMIREIDL